ncbi:small integral membrane protein 1 [Lepisosteus oculatus]|uniref:small integral membrane protein 1 n=1 Tax=Lepisosteus oculatus TaxID=7918 RepID=UPI0003EADEEA|nr:PREDICTED: small integral membrane protein 1 [Lepisosteus oculatus]XP_015192437.1 PREDICTED: small integral membrane protein 1 [Lepisosteus oculatus]
MEPQDTDVRYTSWNESTRDDVRMTGSSSASGVLACYDKMFTGNLGIAVKVAAVLVFMIVIYLIGYVSGYYVHKCK